MHSEKKGILLLISFLVDVWIFPKTGNVQKMHGRKREL